MPDCAEKAGVRLVIQPLIPRESPAVTTVQDRMRAIEGVGANPVYAMLDAAAPTVVQEPISNCFAVLGDR